mmetsp:Transcript_38025/g.98405  ORF Transcript_38025/g.98405 Transcript_38025/m.98405 type:complete len:481 (-) Transcript_38025:163-1605(-)
MGNAPSDCHCRAAWCSTGNPGHVEVQQCEEEVRFCDFTSPSKVNSVKYLKKAAPTSDSLPREPSLGPMESPRVPMISRTSREQGDGPDSGSKTSCSLALEAKLGSPPPAPEKKAVEKKEKASPGDGENTTHVYPNGEVYAGEWNGNRRHGWGIQVWPDGSKYEGEWGDDCCDGMGRFRQPEGVTYEGQWQAGRVHGHGVCISADGSRYAGQWQDDLQHGRGVEKWPNGAMYDGQYVASCRSGKGNFVWPDGSSYEGSFLKNAIHGHGVHHWTDGRKYTGDWLGNKMHGKGKLLWADGRRYEGSFLRDLKHGPGKITWPDGRSYTGSWKDGKRHGPGTYCSAQGEECLGEWLEDGSWVPVQSASGDAKGGPGSKASPRKPSPSPSPESTRKPRAKGLPNLLGGGGRWQRPKAPAAAAPLGRGETGGVGEQAKVGVDRCPSDPPRPHPLAHVGSSRSGGSLGSRLGRLGDTEPEEYVVHHQV